MAFWHYLAFLLDNPWVFMYMYSNFTISSSCYVLIQTIQIFYHWIICKLLCVLKKALFMFKITILINSSLSPIWLCSVCNKVLPLLFTDGGRQSDVRGSSGSLSQGGRGDSWSGQSRGLGGANLQDRGRDVGGKNFSRGQAGGILKS